MNSLDDLPRRGHNAQERKRAGVYDRLLVDKDLEFAIAAVDHGNVGPQLAPHTGRHTDGVDAGDSIATVADGNAGHSPSQDCFLMTQGELPPSGSGNAQIIIAHPGRRGVTAFSVGCCELSAGDAF